MMRLIALSHEAGISLTVAQAYKHPTLKAMAAVTANTNKTDTLSSTVEEFSLLGNRHVAVIDEITTQLGVDVSEIEDCYPCTPLQEGIIIASEQQRGAYMAQQIVDLPQSVDPARLRDAWEKLVSDTPILRTRICHTVAAGCQQVVFRSEFNEASWVVVRDKDHFLAEDLLNPMTFGTHLSRCALYQDLVSGHHQMIWTVHHAIYDGWSIPLFFNALKDIYDGRPRKCGPQFNTYISYLLQQDALQAGAFWAKYLDAQNASVFPEVPISTESHSDTTVSAQVDLSRRPASEFTLSNMIRGAWALVLAKYTNTSDVIFGTMHHGRTVPVPGIENMLGPTINTLPIRVKFMAKESVSQVLSRIQAEEAEMLSYEYFGLRQIQRLSQTIRNACNFKNLLIIQLGDTKAASVSPFPGTMSLQSIKSFITYPLIVHCELGSKSTMEIYATHDPLLIPTIEAERMLNQLAYVLQQIVHDPHQKISDISFIPPEDEVLLNSWNSSSVEAVAMCIHDLIKRQASQNPDSSAVEAFDGSFNYRELDSISSKLSHFLVDKYGIGTDCIIPLCFEKSAWAIVTMLAVLKAGAAFTSLDPAQPQARLRIMIQKVKAKLVLTSVQSQEIFKGENVEQETVSAESIAKIKNRRKSSIEKMSPRNLAFVLFTSGTTGQPKGILLDHAAFVTSSSVWSTRYNLQPQTRVFQFAHYIFDVSLAEIFSTLICGGCVCVPSEYSRMNDLGASINSLNATHLFLTPTVLGTLTPDEVPGVEQIVMVGEPASKHNILTWAERVRLINAYGPAETTTWIACNDSITVESHPGNIGTAWTKVWLVEPDNHNNLSPIGAPGEILIEGAVLAQGYLYDSEQTSHSFITNPKWASKLVPCSKEDQGSNKALRRFYKSGDLARYNADGSLQIIGRKDTQIKMHGQRIEVGEIEFHLRRAVSSEEVAVEIAPAPSPADQPWLVAFLPLDLNIGVLRQLSPLPPGLRTALMDDLPIYMVPTKVCAVESLPRLPSGKLDRKFLRELSAELRADLVAQSAHGTSSAQPIGTGSLNEAEEKLRSLWAIVLNTSPYAIRGHDHFLELGGDSLSAIRLVVAARRVGYTITVANILQKPFLSDMATTLHKAAFKPNEELENIHPFSLLPAPDRVNEYLKEASQICIVAEDQIEDIYPSTPLQEGFMAVSARSKGAYMVQVCFDLPPHVDLSKLQSAWKAAIHDFPILRTRMIQSSSGKLLQVIVADDPLTTCPYHDDFEAYMKNDSEVEMSLGTPLSRIAVILDKATAKRYFVWTAHHTIYDAWSSSLLYQAVDLGYTGGQIGRFPQYSHFIKHLLSLDENAAESYWKSRLAGALKCHFPQMPDGIERPSLDQVTTHSISLRHNYPKGITPSTLLQAAWAILIGRYGETSDVTFACTLSGRTSPVVGIDKIVGPTITTVPIRFQLHRDQLISEFLKVAQDAAIEMIPFQHFGLRKIHALGEEFRDACDFSSLISIQSDLESSLGTESITKYMSFHAPPNFHPYTLVLNCDVRPDSIEIEAVHDSRFIDSVQMRRMCFQFSHIIDQLLQLSEEPLFRVQIFSPEDHTELARINGHTTPTIHRCIHSIIQDRTERFAESPAVYAWDGKLTFSELDTLSNILAHHLITLGVNVGETIPIIFEKSYLVTVAVLATLKAGAAFTLLDATQPTHHIQTILGKLEPHTVLFSQHAAKQSSSTVKRTVTISVEMLGTLQENNPSNCNGKLPSPDPNSIAYVAFTSGSTGAPKGVNTEHASFSSAAAKQAEGYNIDAKSRVLQLAPYNSGYAVMEILTTLLAGGCVCIPDRKSNRDQLSKWIRGADVNWALMTPSMATSINLKTVPGLRTLVYGGEAGCLKNWAEGTNIIQAYGQVESSIASFSQEMIGKVSQNCIGRALLGYTWVVEPGQSDILAPLGAVGELLLEGPHIARGYIDTSTHLENSFILNPKWIQDFKSNTTDDQSRKFFRTGDMVRYNSDGALEYLGRLGMESKLHGKRFEAWKVEGHIRRAVTSKEPFEVAVEVVTASEGPLTAKAPVAFVTFGTGTFDDGILESVSPTAQRLLDLFQGIRSNLLRELPFYMIPASFIPLANLPYTSTRKLNRKLLKLLGQHIPITRLLGKDSVSAPKQVTTKLERDVRRIWANVLNISETTVDSDTAFQSLGGDSVSAIQVVSQCRDIGIYFSVRDLLESRTICDLIPLIESNSKAVEVSKAEEEDEEEDPDTLLPVSPIQQLYFDMVPHGENHYNLSIIVELNKQLNNQSLESALRTLVQRHSSLRTRFVKTLRKGWLQSIVGVSEDHFTLRNHSLEDIDGIPPILEESHKQIDIQEGPLLVADLITVRSTTASFPQRQFLFLASHHLVIDFVSWRIILQDLEDYFLQGRIASPKPLTFQKWVRLQKKYIHEHSKLPATALESPSLPNLDYWGMEGVPNNHGDVVVEQFSLCSDSSHLLLGKANESMSTQPIHLITASILHSFASTFSDRSPPTIFCEGHGRESWDPLRVDISSTVGWFTTFSPISLPSDHRYELLDTVAHVKSHQNTLIDNGWEAFSSEILRKKPFESKYYPIEVSLNYAGQYQQLEREDAIFKVPEEFTEAELGSASPDMPRFGMIEFIVTVQSGIVTVAMAYSRRMRRQSQLKELALKCKAVMEKLARDLASAPKQPTPADYPLLDINSEELRTLITQELPAIGIAHSDIEDIYPLTPVQEGIMITQSKGQGRYDMECEWEILSPEPVDIARLINAWQSVVDRHAMLRTIILDDVRTSGSFIQVVVKNMQANVMCDVSGDGFCTAMRGSTGSKIPEGTLSTSHSMTIKSSHDKILLGLKISHLFLDASSIGILQKDLVLAYDNRLPSSNGPRYSSYVSYVKKSPKEDALSFWKTHLADAGPCYLETWNNSISGSNTSIQSFSVDMPQYASLDRFCRSHALVMSDLLETAWSLVLYLYTGNQCPVFGCIASDREPTLDNSDLGVGVFIRMLISRTYISEKDTFIDVLKRVQSERILRASSPICSAADIHGTWGVQSPGYNTGFSIQRILDVDLDTAVQQSSTLKLHGKALSSNTEYAVSVLGIIFDSKVIINLDCNVHQIPPIFAEQIAATFSAVVKHILKQPESHVLQTNALTCKGKTQLDQWTSHSSTQPKTYIHDIIYEISSTSPDDLAIETLEGSFTYRELKASSSFLCSQLRKIGIGNNHLVAISIEPSEWMVFSMLAVLESGASFILLDSFQSKEILEEIVLNVAPSMIITSSNQAKLFQGLNLPVTQIGENGLLSGMTKMKLEAPTCSVFPPPAFLVVTSESTKDLKTCTVDHLTFCFGAKEHIPVLNLTPRSRTFQYAPYMSGLALLEILVTLIAGGCVCIARKAEDLAQLATFVNQLKVNWVATTPSRLVNLEGAAGIQTLVINGEKEPIHEANIERWIEKCSVLQTYCVAGGSLVATCSASLTNPALPNFGKPVKGYSWIGLPLSNDLPVPPGAIGELILQYTGIVGSHGEEAKDESKTCIKDHQFNTHSTDNVPRFETGQLFRYNQEGNLELMSDKEQDFKLRSRKKTFTQIENYLLTSLSGHITAAAVEAVDLGSNPSVETIVVAFVCSDKKNSRELQQALEHSKDNIRQALPHFTQPMSTFVIQELPLTWHGTLDRRQLHAYALKFLNENRNIDENVMKDDEIPLSPHELTLRDIWATVLNLQAPEISRLDHFFNRGGTSLSALQLVANAKKQSIPLAIHQVFQHPTFGKMAIACAATSAQKISKTQKGNKKPEYFTDKSKVVVKNIQQHLKVPGEDIDAIAPASAVQRMYYGANHLKTRAALVHFCLDIEPSIRMTDLKSACEKLIQRHDILRTVFVPYQRSLYQAVLKSTTGIVEEHVSPDDKIEIAVKDFIEDDRKKGLKLGEIVTRFVFIHGREKAYLIVRLSHAQYDGITLPLLFKDLSQLYDGHTPPQYPQFSEFLNIRKQTLDHQTPAFYKRLLSGSTMPRLSNSISPFSAREPKGFLQQTVRLSRIGIAGITTSLIVKVAWALVLGKLSASPDVVFGEVVTNRRLPLPDIEGVIGPCLNLVPVRINTSGLTVMELLSKIRAQHLESFAHEAYEFEDILDNCVSWPGIRRFSSLVIHQDIQFVTSGLQKFVSIGGVPCGLQVTSAAFEIADVGVMSVPYDDHLEVSLSYDSANIATSVMQATLDSLCSIISFLSQEDNADSVPIADVLPVDISHPYGGSRKGMDHKERNSELHQTVKQCWHEIFGTQSREDKTTVFELGGDILTCAQLAYCYRKAGFNIAVEDIMANPSQEEQEGMLLSAGVD
ncbi:non-ribosomal peptide synthetase NPS2 [Bipolaris sorokiniana ND90Pr]|uniref:Non-ribosomal peptide synthetase NPS2 n=1 Tax=Cochliobolus sativus (strain ND90Pr / ATCC 201652) TaxID=665912 RepID=M2RSJ5_COCSN|nr:non-ribosomal peptide synthetase NPS2 [Bipolaris sorokiniana ND90Pr]EMD58213.1 non-ribosomal peptide synthetase NPS2 [Bipolaris sorokiniana ND90Pr]